MAVGSIMESSRVYMSAELPASQLRLHRSTANAQPAHWQQGSNGMVSSVQHTASVSFNSLQVSTHAVALTAVAVATGVQHNLQSAWIVAAAATTTWTAALPVYCQLRQSVCD
ncbi:TPA: hypothetical protein ACH3X2_000557 [Trebouxia sp. C0005]